MLTRSANAADIHGGRRVRTARLGQRISQEKLAKAVGVSFQQIQKYEKGVNRTATGRLHTIARFFDLPATYFFDGMDKHPGKPSRDSSMSAITETLSTKKATALRLLFRASKVLD